MSNDEFNASLVPADSSYRSADRNPAALARSAPVDYGSVEAEYQPVVESNRTYDSEKRRLLFDDNQPGISFHAPAPAANASVNATSTYPNHPYSQDSLARMDNSQTEERKVESSIWASVLNLSNTILGAGVLGLPFAIAKSGLTVGMILFCLFAGLSGLGLQLMCFAAREVPGSDFAKLSALTVPRAKILVDAAVAIKCFGVGTSYLIVAGDLMPEVMNYFLDKGTSHRSTWKDRHIWISLFTVLFVLPIVRLKHLDNLKFISTFCLMFFGVVVATIFVYRFDDSDTFDACKGTDDCPGTIRHTPGSIKDFLGVAPLYIFGFTCHQNAFSITNELKDNSRFRLTLVVVFAMTVCLVVYASASWAGYTSFGDLDDFPQDILEQYPESGKGAWLPTIVRIVLSVNLSLSYALQCNPCRNSVSNLIWKKRAVALTDRQFYILTYSIALSSWVVAMSVSSLGAVLAIVGATGSTAISYILPGLFYYYSFKDKPDEGLRKYVAFALMCFGLCVVPFALAMVFWSGEAAG